MAKMYDVSALGRKYENKDGDEKTVWTRIGVAFPREKGGLIVKLDALPLTIEGQSTLLITEQEERDAKGERKGKKDEGI